MKVKIFPSIMKIKTNHRNNKYRNDYVKFYEYTFLKSANIEQFTAKDKT